MKVDVQVTKSSGNVFRDVGISGEESAHLLVRSDLLIQLQKTLESRGLKQAETAKILDVTQPRVSDLLRRRIGLFGTDALIDMLARRRRAIGCQCPEKWPDFSSGWDGATGGEDSLLHQHEHLG
jgi:predicted XRE-type DNA-binding protein